jgi:hypothetical protein
MGFEHAAVQVTALFNVSLVVPSRAYGNGLREYRDPAQQSSVGVIDRWSRSITHRVGHRSKAAEARPDGW